MFEIALWKDIHALTMKSRSSSALRSTEVRDAVEQKCKGEVPHRVGEVMAQIILTCIKFGEQTKGMSEYESQMYFQHHISGKLGKLVGRI